MQLRSGKQVGFGYTCKVCKKIIDGPVYVKRTDYWGHYSCLFNLELGYCEVINLPKFKSCKNGLIPYINTILDSICISYKEISLLACLFKSHSHFVGFYKFKSIITRKTNNQIVFGDLESCKIRDVTIILQALVNILPREIIQIIINMCNF